jgi:SpoVK/Ycf46/Vps4 family AAA+-type ATPase
MKQSATRSIITMELTAQNHFRVNLYAAIYFIAYFLWRLEDDKNDSTGRVIDKHPFLAEYFKELRSFLLDGIQWHDSLDWWRTQIIAWELPKKNDFPLTRIEKASGFGFSHRIALLCAGLVEEDSRFGGLCADLLQPIQSRRPTFELLARIIGYGDVNVGASVVADLCSSGLLSSGNKSDARADWSLSLPRPLWESIKGNPALETEFYRSHDLAEFCALDEQILPAYFKEELSQLATFLRQGYDGIVALRSVHGADPLSIIGSVCKELTIRTIEIRNTSEINSADSAWFGPFCLTVAGAAVFSFEPGPGEIVAVPTLCGYHGPLFVLMGMEGSIRADGRKLTVLKVPLPGPEERKKIWQSQLGKGFDNALVDSLAKGFMLPAGYIHQAASIASNRALLQGDTTIGMAHIRDALRDVGRQLLQTHASLLTDGETFDDLVTTPFLDEKLAEFITRCKHREEVLPRLGQAFHNSGPGVRALFVGPSGTGKTLAARVVGGELGKDVYKVDLAAVINKYIGETEKNLSRVLSAAEELDVILLLDEGDALLGKRTEIRSANDRYANLETNYLLQRLETYNGIVIVTTNAAEHLDSAFARRMDIVLQFSPPGPEERLHLWRLHLPGEHTIEYSDMEYLASAWELTGGQIRNAAKHACLTALKSGVPLTLATVMNAVKSEYKKSGSVVPATENGLNSENAGADRFVSFLTGMKAS